MIKKILLLLFGIVNAQEITVIKEAPDTINFNEILSVNLKITNLDDIEKSYQIIETIPQGVSLIDPSEPDEVQKYNALSVNLYKWNIDIKPKETFTITYKIKPDNLGEYIIPPTKVNDLSTNYVFLSDSKQIIVSCVSNNQCEANENSLNCPDDCSTGMADGICDYKADERCDPDCEEEPDCKNTGLGSSVYLIVIGIISLFIIIFLIKLFKKPKVSEINIDAH